MKRLRPGPGLASTTNKRLERDLWVKMSKALIELNRARDIVFHCGTELTHERRER